MLGPSCSTQSSSSSRTRFKEEALPFVNLQPNCRFLLPFATATASSRFAALCSQLGSLEHKKRDHPR